MVVPPNVVVTHNNLISRFAFDLLLLSAPISIFRLTGRRYCDRLVGGHGGSGFRLPLRRRTDLCRAPIKPEVHKLLQLGLHGTPLSLSIAGQSDERTHHQHRFIVAGIYALALSDKGQNEELLRDGVLGEESRRLDFGRNGKCYTALSGHRYFAFGEGSS